MQRTIARQRGVTRISSTQLRILALLLAADEFSGVAATSLALQMEERAVLLLRVTKPTVAKNHTEQRLALLNLPLDALADLQTSFGILGNRDSYVSAFWHNVFRNLSQFTTGTARVWKTLLPASNLAVPVHQADLVGVTRIAFTRRRHLTIHLVHAFRRSQVVVQGNASNIRVFGR